MTETDAYIQRLTVVNPLIEPTVYSAIRALRLPRGSHGLDAGCGIGLQALLLAESVGPAGRVTGLDISPEFLAHAQENVKKSGLSEQILFQEGSVSKLPFADDAFDWAWSSDCVGYSASLEPLSAVKELARVVRPGGGVTIFAWSSERLLTGYPVLEARLNATSSGIAPFVKEKGPERHFLRALGWFRDAGLRELSARTFAGGAHAPLSDALRNALVSLFEMRWPGVESELTQKDRSEYRRLCLPGSPDFILDHPDYYGFFTCSMFSGMVTR
ncbi:MAG: class I SAM-dependent methyltransferase [Deltaproteobacteria bacterium]|nr:class I SAM-dependent methyltransferase [Candidatus Zymogenaceae bacterium]